MEALFIYIAKSAGLVTLFYFAYYFLLRKETFFNSNRWFLLAGLITSVVLPFLVYTKVIWVDPAPLSNLSFSEIDFSQTKEKSFEINWNYIILSLYGIGFLVFLIKFTMDFYSLHSVLRGKKVQQQADFKFIDTSENIAPFSYFEYIVYNSSMFTASELENIIEHEKIHSDQNHTADVLMSRIFCLLFWFNPIIWLYKKAITQNLEFIADKEAAKKIADKRAYQYTLLKITTHESCIAITNHFYQSLIKKRIVMLNKNQSKKRNVWKYYVVIPALAAFVLLFQVEVEAHERTTVETLKNDKISTDVFRITKTTTDEELKEKTKTFKENYDITVTFSEIERNSKNEIISIKVDLEKGSEIAQKMSVKGTDAIKAFGIIISKLENGKLSVDFKTEENAITNENVKALAEAASIQEREIFIDGSKATEEEMNSLDPKQIESMDVTKISGKGTIRIITKNLAKPIKISNKEIYINGVKSDAKELESLDQKNISSVDVNTTENTVRIITKTVTNTGNTITVNTNTNVNTSGSQIIKPLIIINGVKADPEVTINDVPSKDIISVNVLKGKLADDKYGSEGKNGVVEIVTKQNSWKVTSGVNGSDVLSAVTMNKNIDFKKAVIIIDGKISDYKALKKINSGDIKMVKCPDMNNYTEEQKNEAVKVYGEKAVNGFIEVQTTEYYEKHKNMRQGIPTLK